MSRSERSRKKTVEPIPNRFASAQKAGEFWETHSVADYWNGTNEVPDVKIKLVRRHFRVDADLAHKIHNIARKRGVSPETLVNLWLQEKIS